jgi:hypothetical protein
METPGVLMMTRPLWFTELVEERGYNPFDLSAEVAKEIILATKAAAEILEGNLHHVPRFDT